MSKGSLAIVLHAHLPYVRHPEHEYFLEENWLFEAITDTYLPLLEMMDRLRGDGVEYRLTMTLTPTLVSMLEDPLLRGRYLRHLGRTIELAEKEIERTKGDAELNRLAHFYREKLARSRSSFEDIYPNGLAAAFRSHQDAGHLEIITCGATHGFLPLMAGNEPARRAQIEIAVQHYRGVFGRSPRGIWLPECGYDTGVDSILADHGLRFFITETHGILNSRPRPRFGVFAPIACPSRVVAFGRDPESSRQVWSAEVGYPGDPWYREYYRDVGFDLDFDYVRPYIHPDGIRIGTGIKYHRITGSGVQRELYDPERARERADVHAGNFVFNRVAQIDHLRRAMSREPVVVAPYDAELFGHWWYEGPIFLEYVLRKSIYDQDSYRLTTLSEYLERNPEVQIATPSPSSWGDKGYSEVWLNEKNDWIYFHLHSAAGRMVELARENPEPDALTRRALDQCARELLLAQSSDWAFIMNSGKMTPYAHKRTVDHVDRFNRIHDQVRGCCVDESMLIEVERRDMIFPDIDYRVYAS